MLFLLTLLGACAAPAPTTPCADTVASLALATAGAIAGTKWSLLDAERVDADLARASGVQHTPGPYATPEAAQTRAEQLWCPALEKAASMPCAEAMARYAP